MEEKGFAKPKEYLLYRNIESYPRIYIHCFPQQKWKYCIYGENVYLTRNKIDLQIPLHYFEKNWNKI